MGIFNGFYNIHGYRLKIAGIWKSEVVGYAK
jgi:hypothetical protein